jgi:alkanesulfonate monooxygenase SsuD/methylene tetrahydromethanopterin reductase-like flavin-dependent oxidoreductase (luciferase family)
LAAAAAATSRIRLGTYVVNAGAREPLHLASEVATLDVVSGGRAVFGAGAGHTPAEWTMFGRPYPSPG